ncbi:succinate dehydrogenase [ubiquinone] flavoprotein subunit, mitochondrial [Plakobranchus ocellatus]|uniref:Succinate dehydrogenase [ubiquinone] flavoprotein subunit, mitochondrial n=1 Tax=Plakobranchus ocellatus TaxID=259542 RepID=A0AAV3YF28_9GAST|nr:succinate dehydrogenase [ubiquinone] flavoprotein subunit, mitochondrial [Plakobranchus ocellatus]
MSGLLLASFGHLLFSRCQVCWLHSDIRSFRDIRFASFIRTFAVFEMSGLLASFGHSLFSGYQVYWLHSDICCFRDVRFAGYIRHLFFSRYQVHWLLSDICSFRDISSVTPGTRCNFCCNDTSPLGIPCNTNLRPEKTISFLPQPPPVSRKCYQCGNPLSGEPCGPGDLLLGASSACPPGQQFCMNDIFDKAGSGRTIYKRCVDETECRNKWFKESSDTNECAYYDPRGSVASDLTCHFCCTEDGCNRSTKPAGNTLWTPFNTGG